MSYKNVPEQVDVLLECSEHLKFARDMVARLPISDDLKDGFNQKIQNIKQRQQDPNLYLGVVGEFSSGKSTLINALLRDEILKTSALVATATATRIKHGQTIEVSAAFSNGRGKIHKTESGVEGDLSCLPGVKDMDSIHLIQTLTSEENIASSVTNIVINHPATFLSNGVVIIDTPGTNANNTKHGLITQKVIRQEVDLAIIVIPATMPLSQSLASFLSGPLKPFLHRCIFVVTKIDEIKAIERGELVQNLCFRLGDQLEIEQPVLYPCSAQVVLDVLNNETDISRDSDFFCSQFSSLEKLIVSRLSRERVISIAESLLRLLTQLFQELDNRAKLRWKDYKKQQAEITRNTIPDLSTFTREQYLICDRQLQALMSGYTAQITNCVDSHRKIAKETVRKQLFGASNEESLNSVVSSKTESILVEESIRLKANLQQLTAQMSEQATTVGKTFDHKFSEVYKRLQSIGGDVEPDFDNHYNFTVNASNITVSARTLTKELDSGDGTKMGLGAAAGLALGTVLLPGVGSLVGLAAGTWASKLFTPSLDERKQQLWQQLRPSIEKYFDTIHQQVQATEKKHTQSLNTALKQRIDAYVQKYKTIVEGILNQQKIELAHLNELQASIQVDLTELEERQLALSKKQALLAEMENFVGEINNA